MHCWTSQQSERPCKRAGQPLGSVPIGLVSGLTPLRLEAVLAHELAHIRRFDPAVNVLQRLVEAMLFFHPAVWWVSRRVSASSKKLIKPKENTPRGLLGSSCGESAIDGPCRR